MIRIRTFLLAAAVAVAAAASASAPASAAEGTGCNQQGFRTKVNGDWHHHVWIKETVKGHVMYTMIDCGPAF
jgi:hypothetical protein